MNKAEDLLIHVIEDDEQSRKFLVTLLSKSNFKTIQSETGIKALETLNDTSVTPNLFLIDIMMPNMNGFEVIKKLRTLDRFKKTAIIVTTALDDAEHIKEAISSGANAYVVKPINISRLTGKINEFLGTAI
ncbi:MAG: hypothetical protein IEMM0008_0238 [bacterium]|nr:MAG: hypothetical protein IEMM0008_0238 [bacterium]